MMTNVIFLNRAYNDFDMQASVMAELSRQGFANIQVIGLICDNGIAEPYTHELHNYLAAHYNIDCKRVTELQGCPMPLRLSSASLAAIRKIRRSSDFMFSVLKPLDLVVRNIQRHTFKNIDHWIKSFAEEWRGSIVILDELTFQKERSPIVDYVIQYADDLDLKVFALKTGHHIYRIKDPAGQGNTVKLEQRSACHFSVSGPIDEKLETESIPHIPVKRFGNPRMDHAWVNEITDLLAHNPTYMNRLPAREDGKINVSIMLSKINYGVEVEALKQCLRDLAHNPNVQLCIKPHTRGMKFDFMPLSELPGAHLRSDIPSTCLIEWSDLVLFTGSSIAFHAYLRGKMVGFLKYVQTLPTIFDDGLGCKVIESSSQLMALIDQDLKRQAAPPPLPQYEDIPFNMKNELWGTDQSPNVSQKIVHAIKSQIEAL